MTQTSSSMGVLLLLAAVACGSDGGTTSNNTTATQIAIQSGNNQVAAAGTALAPLQVLLLDAADAPVEGVTVNWAVGSGGGSVSAATSISGVNGIASITRTLGPNAGTQTTTATRAGLAGSPITFSAIAQVQGATQIALATVSGNNQTDTVLAPLPTPYAVLVRDQNNDPVANVTVTWTAPAGTILPATSQTNASGIATATRTLGGTAGAQTAQAAVTGLSGSPVAFTATASAGNAAVLLKTSGDGGTSGINTMVTYTVTVQDGHGNPKAGQQVDWSVVSGGGSISPTDNITAANGQAVGTRTLSGNAGVHTARAVAANNQPTPDTVTFTTTATALPAVATVTVGDNFFNPDSVLIAVGGTVTWDWGAGGGTHNVTFAAVAGAPTNIANRNSGSQARTFASAGSFNYQCTIHAGMNGKVVAQ